MYKFDIKKKKRKFYWKAFSVSEMCKISSHEMQRLLKRQRRWWLPWQTHFTVNPSNQVVPKQILDVLPSVNTHVVTKFACFLLMDRYARSSRSNWWMFFFFFLSNPTHFILNLKVVASSRYLISHRYRIRLNWFLEIFFFKAKLISKWI